MHGGAGRAQMRGLRLGKANARHSAVQYTRLEVGSLEAAVGDCTAAIVPVRKGLKRSKRIGALGN